MADSKYGNDIKDTDPLTVGFYRQETLATIQQCKAMTDKNLCDVKKIFQETLADNRETAAMLERVQSDHFLNFWGGIFLGGSVAWILTKAFSSV